MKYNIKSTRNNPIDETDLFIKHKSAKWLLGVLSKYPTIDEETLDFVIWLTSYNDKCTKKWMEISLQAKLADFIELRRNPENDRFDDEQMVMSLYKEMNKREKVIFTEATIFALEVVIAGTMLSSQCSMAVNLQKMADTFGLCSEEVDAGLFLALKEEWTPIERFFDTHLSCDRISGRRFFEAALGLTQREFHKVLNGKLTKIGIINNQHSWLSIDNDFMPMFLDPSDDFDTADIQRRVQKTDLPFMELDIPEKEVSNISMLLKSTDDRPVHILLYGPPGTGKSTFARGLARKLCKDSVEVMGFERPSVKHRQAALEACMHMTANATDRVVVVDEADHLLSQAISSMVSGSAADKTWVNSVLERPQSRCIWVVNQASDIHPAIKRRFTYSLEMGLPKKESREKIIFRVLRKHKIKSHFNAAQISELAENYLVSPGNIEQAASTASLWSSSKAECIRVFKDSLNSKLKLSGAPVPKTKLESKISIPFMSNGLNTSMPFDRLIKMTTRYSNKWKNDPTVELPAMNLLFHGVPGTGKTVLAKQLAKELDRPLLIIRASDVLDKYIGGTEKNIVQAFNKARQVKGILLLDEIDSLLADRTGAERNWEVSQVNELLTQMEHGPAIMIAATNNVQKMDKASMRRFLSRIEFSPLQSTQVIDVYNKVFRPLVGRAKLTRFQMKQLQSMKSLTTAELVRIRQRLELLCDKTDHTSILEEFISERPQQSSHVAGFLN
jgi:SpoVK/Ycf46/Vps4 family AAA+-type ATPase